jgi:hypothetical protein
MLNRTGDLTRWLWRAAIAAALAVLWGCAELPPPTGAAALPGIPPGEARIWIYRDYEPYQTLARPYVRLNDRVVGISEPGGAFYRNVSPGVYRTTVDTYGYDVNQFADVPLAAGQTAYVKIESLKFWWGRNRSSSGYDTFYTRLIPPELAQGEVARSPFYGGG